MKSARTTSPLEAHVALLRGINVGGKNLIRMADLRTCFEDEGFASVQTYIASGNVIFESGESDPARLTKKIERTLSKTFDYSARIVLRSRRQMDDVIAGAPRGFGDEPGEYRSDVLFLRDSCSPAAALEVVPAREGVDEVCAGPGVLYFSRLIARATESRMNRIVGLPIYQDMTIRNWNTTTKLAGLLTRRAASG